MALDRVQRLHDGDDRIRLAGDLQDSGVDPKAFDRLRQTGIVGEDDQLPLAPHLFQDPREPVHPRGVQVPFIQAAVFLSVPGLEVDLPDHHRHWVFGPEPKPGEPQGALPPIRLHDLRHVHATTLLLAGVPVHVVANRLGHADPSTTLRVYAHVLREQAAGAADVFAQAVEAAVSKAVSK